jgi:hypothetical protein
MAVTLDVFECVYAMPQKDLNLWLQVALGSLQPLPALVGTVDGTSHG